MLGWEKEAATLSLATLGDSSVTRRGCARMRNRDKVKRDAYNLPTLSNVCYVLTLPILLFVSLNTNVPDVPNEQ